MRRSERNLHGSKDSECHRRKRMAGGTAAAGRLVWSKEQEAEPHRNNDQLHASSLEQRIELR